MDEWLEKLYKSAARGAVGRDVNVVFEPLPEGTLGMLTRDKPGKNYTITIDPRMPDQDIFDTFLHELAHALWPRVYEPYTGQAERLPERKRQRIAEGMRSQAEDKASEDIAYLEAFLSDRDGIFGKLYKLRDSGQHLRQRVKYPWGMGL